tara:strand:+ start:154 stop:438 length:285 start_codon:yes stop_codon:yes gene_type:complete
MKIKDAVIREKYSSRGGGVEIDLTPYGYDGEKLSAYQNYLGGGMLGSVQNDCTITDWQGNMELIDKAMELKMLFCRNMGLSPDFLDVMRPERAY